MDTLSRYKILTITHKSTSIKNIGKYILSDLDTTAKSKQKLQEIKSALDLDELLYIPTCNRVLFLMVTPQQLSSHFLQKFQAIAYPKLDVSLDTACNTFEGKDAIQHLLAVASSTDSLVVGEREILRQLREGNEKCLKAGITGDSIRIAMQLAVETAKKVYSNTRIGEKPVSVVSLAIRQLLARNPAKDARILLVGAGQTNMLVGKLLLKYGFQNFTVFNRSLGNAEQLTDFLGGSAHTLDELASYDKGFDILIACTGATEAIITAPVYAALVQDDAQKILIDLSIPNNINQPALAAYATDYIEIAGLNDLISENLAFREKEVAKAQAIIMEQTQNFESIYKGRQVELALREVPQQIKAIKSHAIDNVFKNELSDLDSEAQELIQKMMAYMEKRCIAIPIQVAKENLAGVKSVKKIKVGNPF